MTAHAHPPAPNPLPGIETTLLAPGIHRIRAEVEPGEPPPPSPEVERIWSEMAAKNPRLFDGPVLSITAFDPATGTLRIRWDTYKRLVVQPGVETGVRQFAVTALLTRPGPRAPEVLLGRRGLQTRMYDNMWEIGPSGGVDGVRPGAAEYTHEDIVEEVRREVREEAGLEIGADARALALIYDHHARSHDLVMRIDLPPGAGDDADHHDWEYQEVRWVPLDELRDWERARGHDMLGTTRAMIRELL